MAHGIHSSGLIFVTSDPLVLIKSVLARHRERLVGRSVVLFGSRALGTARPCSDYDIAVVGDEASPLPLADFYAIEEELDELPTLYSIDWVDFSRVSPEFRARALQGSQIIFP